MKTRVVITGLGVAAPNGVGLESFLNSIRQGTSGIQHFPKLKELGFSCCIGGVPEVSDELKKEYLTDLQLKNFNSSGILYGCMAGMDAWADAGMSIMEKVDYDSGAIFGTGTAGVEKFREAVYKLDDGKVRKLGSTAVAQTMASGASAYLGGILGLGNQVTANSSACTTGTEAVLMGYERISTGRAKRMLVGSCSDHGPYLWGGFDAMRVLTYKHNDSPEAGSRPMSTSASGFVPGSGAGALVLESLDSALGREARIYGEVLGGEINSGGQRNGGSMTASNGDGAQKCIRAALRNTGTKARDIDLINGHLTATSKDAFEVRNWSLALGLKGDEFPRINSLKSITGHCLAAAGSIECVASVLQLEHGFIAPNINCEDLNEEITDLISPDCIPQKIVHHDINIIAKASFGFGDVNACVIFKKYTE